MPPEQMDYTRSIFTYIFTTIKCGYILHHQFHNGYTTSSVLGGNLLYKKWNISNISWAMRNPVWQHVLHSCLEEYNYVSMLYYGLDNSLDKFETLVYIAQSKDRHMCIWGKVIWHVCLPKGKSSFYILWTRTVYKLH